jgi:hypothetical protein
MELKTLLFRKKKRKKEKKKKTFKGESAIVKMRRERDRTKKTEALG